MVVVPIWLDCAPFLQFRSRPFKFKCHRRPNWPMNQTKLTPPVESAGWIYLTQPFSWLELLTVWHLKFESRNVRSHPLSGFNGCDPNIHPSITRSIMTLKRSNKTSLESWEREEPNGGGLESIGLLPVNSNCTATVL